MSIASYGNTRTSDVSINDVDIFYTYVTDRSVVNTNAKASSIDATTVLSAVQHPTRNDILGGMYNLTLPTNIFGNLGIYDILIKPKEIPTVISDIGVLSARPDITGLVLDVTDPTLANYASKLNNNGLTGYRIEYFDTTTGLKTPNLFRVVTSANRCEPITENLTNTNQKSIRYRFNDNGSLLFLTLTPGAASNIKTTATPFLGNVGQQILIYNTFFDPIMLEVEMVDETVESLADALLGSQSETSDGVLTLYSNDTNKDIIAQYLLDVTQDSFGGTTTKVKQRLDSIDNSKSYNNLFNSTDL